MIHPIHSSSNCLLTMMIATAAFAASVRAEITALPTWEGTNATIAEWNFDDGESYTFSFNWIESSPAQRRAEQEFERTYYTINDYFDSFTEERIETGTHERGAPPEEEEVLTFDSSLFADIFNSDESTATFSTTEFREPVTRGSARGLRAPLSGSEAAVLDDWDWDFDWDSEPVSFGDAADEYDFGWSAGGVNSTWFDQRNQS